MFCQYCGTHLPESARFCPQCGKPCPPPPAETPAQPVVEAKPPVEAKPQPAVKPAKAKRPWLLKKSPSSPPAGGRKRRALLIGGLALALVLVVGIWVLGQSGSRPPSSVPSGDSSPQADTEDDDEIIEYPDGSLYIGETLNGVPHGKGVMAYPPEDDGFLPTYSGDWVNGKREGFGEMDMDDGLTYEGEWKNDLENGEGSLIADGWFTMTGPFVDGKREGEFIITFADGTVQRNIYENDNSVFSEILQEGESSSGGSSSDPEQDAEQSGGSGSSASRGPTVPDLMSFSGDTLYEYQSRDMGSYTEVVYYVYNFQMGFLEEYQDLLTDRYDLSLKAVADSGSSYKSEYTYTYTGSGDVETFDDGISFHIWLMNTPNEGEIHIRYADGLSYTDTGERTSISLDDYEDRPGGGGSSSGGGVAPVTGDDGNEVTIRCSKCHGTGSIACTNCGGLGYKETTVGAPNYSGNLSGPSYGTSKQTCYKCNGSGSITCTRCGGSGRN